MPDGAVLSGFKSLKKNQVNSFSIYFGEVVMVLPNLIFLVS